MTKRKYIPAFEVPEDAHNAVAEVAQKEGKSIAGVVRAALEEYIATRSDTPVSFNIGDWGGWRGGPKEKNTE